MFYLKYCRYFRESSLPVDMKPLPKEPDADDRKKEKKIKTPKGNVNGILHL